MPFWCYILRCADGSYYTGSTDFLEARIGQHQLGQGSAHTRRRRPVVLRWCQEFPTRLEAMEAERRIKGWSRAKKEALIASDWKRLSELARNRQVQNGPSTSSGRTEVSGEWRVTKMNMAGLRPTHPGEVLREIVLPAVAPGKAEIARMLGVSRQHLYDVLGKQKPITSQMALRLARLFGGEPDTWLRMQMSYDLRVTAEVMADELAIIPQLKAA